MSIAVEVLQGELAEYQRAQRVSDRYSAHPEYPGPAVAYKPIIDGLQLAIARLQIMEGVQASEAKDSLTKQASQ